MEKVQRQSHWKGIFKFTNNNRFDGFIVVRTDSLVNETFNSSNQRLFYGGYGVFTQLNKNEGISESNQDTKDKTLEKKLIKPDLEGTPKLPNQFKRGIWKNVRTDFCRFPINSDRNFIVGEFVEDKLLKRNQEIKSDYEFYYGDVLIDETIKAIMNNLVKPKNQKKIKHEFGRLMTRTHIHIGLFRFDKLYGQGTMIIRKNEKTLKMRIQKKEVKQ